MSALEIIMVVIYIAGFLSAVLVFWNYDDLPDAVGAYTILYSIVVLCMWVFSCFQTSESMISSNRAEILRVVETENHLQFDYVGECGLSSSVRFDSMSEFLKYKNGKTLYIEQHTKNTWFGLDLNRTKVILK